MTTSITRVSSSRAGTVLIGAIAPVLAVVGFIAWGSEVPDSLPTHWNVGGHVDGTTGGTAFFVAILTVSMVLVLFSVLLMSISRTRQSSRLLVAILTSAAWLAAGIYLMSLGLSRHAASAGQVRLPWYLLLVTVALPLAVGAVVFAVRPAQPSPLGKPHPSSQIHVGTGERVVWISRAHSTGMRWLAVVLVVAAGGLALFAAGAAVICLLVALLVLLTSELTVRVDDDGLHTLWGPLGWPRHRMRLEVISEAAAQDIRPMQWGGWGFRISSRGTAANIRSGPGIVVRRSNGSSYVVTVDDAEEGAAVLTALLVRTGSGR